VHLVLLLSPVDFRFELVYLNPIGVEDVAYDDDNDAIPFIITSPYEFEAAVVIATPNK